MKKFTFFVAALLISTLSFAQLSISSQQAVTKQNFGHDGAKNYTDTLFTYLERATNFYTYSAGAAYGYVGISNAFSTDEAMHFSFTGNASVNEVLFWFGKKYKNGATDVHTVTIYAANAADSLPGASLGTSTFTTDDVDTSGNLSSCVFVSPAAVTGNFLVGVSGMSASNNDTLVIVFNSVADGDGQNEHRFKCKTIPTYGGAWMTLGDLFTGGFNADAMVFPVLNVQSGINTASNNNLTLLGAYPNPASTQTTIQFTLQKESEVTISVFDLTGRTSFEYKQVLSNGSHNVDVDVTNLPAGNYYYNISTREGRMTSKFQVVK